MRRLKYQIEAVNKTTNDIILSLEAGDKGQEVCLKAPTGSGKTYMAGKIIEQTIKDYGDPISFVWLSIGKGDLHTQSRNAIEGFIDPSIKCKCVEDLLSSGKSVLEPSTIVFASWDSLRVKDKDTGEWKSVYMRDGDNINFRELINNSKHRMIMIIDESHVASDTDRALEIRQILNPDVIFEMTATPKKEVYEGDLFGREVLLTEVPLQDVINSGMIVKDVQVNAGIGKFEGTEEDSQRVVLEAAYEHAQKMKHAYKAEGADVLPLTSVVIPNAKAGSAKLEHILSYYEHKGLTEKNKRLAIYLSDYKSSHFDPLNDNGVTEVVIFKQGLDTGWDCPRAKILNQFRNVKSEIFSAQLIGRHYRTPERKHYRSEILNHAYIFTDISDAQVKHDSYSPNMVKSQVAYLKPDVVSPVFVSNYRRRIDQGTVGQNVYNTLKGVFCEHFNITGPFVSENINKMREAGINFDVDIYKEDIVRDVSVDLESVGNRDSLTGFVSKDKSVDLYLSDTDREIRFEAIIWDNISGYFKSKDKSISAMKEAIYKWFKEYTGTRVGYTGAISVQSIILHPDNLAKFCDLIYHTIEDYKPKRDKEIQNKVKFESFEWRLPEVERFNSNYEEIKFDKYAYEKCYLKISRSKPEKDFEKWLDSNPKVLWWYKNGDHGRNCFGIRYRKSDGFDDVFYPDYVVAFTDGSFGIFDTKSGLFAEATNAGNKAKALYRYVKDFEEEISIGGIVVSHHDRWRLSNRENYKFDPFDMSGWEHLEEIL